MNVQTQTKAKANQNQPMSFRAHLAISAAPIVLRLAMGLAMLWLGFGMLASTVTVPEAARPALASMGIEPLETESATGIVIQRVYSKALFIHDAANPPFDDATGIRRAPLWPAWASAGNTPRFIAVSCMIGALLVGVVTLLGLGTRFAAALCGVLVLATLWLEHCVPAIHSGSALAGFLPNHAPFDLATWAPITTWVLLFAVSFALLLSGPGRLSIDALLFRAPRAGGG